MSSSNKRSKSETLKLFTQCLNKVPDPRSKHGTYQPFPTILALVFLGLIANVTTITQTARWAKQHFHKLKKFLPFGESKVSGGPVPPCNNTITRVLKKLSLSDLQNAFAEFANLLLADTSLVAAVDGKTAKQMFDQNGDPIHMLNIFAHTLKVHLASWSVKGDKTNEPNCLKQHLGELFTMFPCLKLLTGDAIFAQRPLLEALQEYHCDYLFQVKSNQPKVLAKMKQVFKDAPIQKPNHCWNRKKRGLEKHVVCG
jgi:hypothetical protein